MKRCLICVTLLFLTGCAAKEPSQTIAASTLRDVSAVRETVKKIEVQTPAECKSEVFMAHLESINRQVSGIGGQIESISAACQTEKQVLEERITARNGVIFGLGVLILVLGWFVIRKGK